MRRNHLIDVVCSFNMNFLIQFNSNQIKSNLLWFQEVTCRCVDGYHGVDCGIPDVVWNSEQAIDWGRLRARRTPRRIIHAFNFNHEIEFFDIRMAEVGSLLSTIHLLSF